MYNNVYSEFEVLDQYITIGEDTYQVACVGTCEVTRERKTITKNCRGSVERQKTKATGNGTIKETLHVPRAVYLKLYGMTNDGLVDGVYSEPEGCQHPEFMITQEIHDEDDEIKYKAFPRCVVSGEPDETITNGAEEVAEIDVEIRYMRDKNRRGMYEALAKELDESVASQWMEHFTPELVALSTHTGE